MMVHVAFSMVEIALEQQISKVLGQLLWRNAFCDIICTLSITNNYNFTH